jgi:hypothetical protein
LTRRSAARRASRLGAALLVAGTFACGGVQPARAGTIDGISDQSLPAWGGAFAASPLAAWIAQLARGPARRLRYARYVVQWDAMSEPSAGAGLAGDYRERLEAWLLDVRSLGLSPVLALTSYDGRRPASSGEYATELAALLNRARALGAPVAYLEPWNEPNNQGREPAAIAVAQANEAAPLCARAGCTVIAADIEDGPGMLAYEHRYERALAFTPTAWGLHPYHALAARSLARVLAFLAALPAGGRGAEVWATEAAAFYCRAGQTLGETAQAAEASYLAGPLARTLAHVLYYGVAFADSEAAPCAAARSSDSELFALGDRPRPAAAIVLGASADGEAPLIGPLPGQDALVFAPLV